MPKPTQHTTCSNAALARPLLALMITSHRKPALLGSSSDGEKKRPPLEHFPLNHTCATKAQLFRFRHGLKYFDETGSK